MNTKVIFKFSGVRLGFLHCPGTVITKYHLERRKNEATYRGFIDNSILYAQWNYFDAFRLQILELSCNFYAR